MLGGGEVDHHAPPTTPSWTTSPHHRTATRRLDRDALETYLQPKKPATADPDLIRDAGRGVAYTRPASAYVFGLLDRP